MQMEHFTASCQVCPIFRKYTLTGASLLSAKHTTTIQYDARHDKPVFLFLCKSTPPQWLSNLAHMDAPLSNSLHLSPIIQCQAPMRSMCVEQLSHLVYLNFLCCQCQIGFIFFLLILKLS